MGGKKEEKNLSRLDMVVKFMLPCYGFLADALLSRTTNRGVIFTLSTNIV